MVDSLSVRFKNASVFKKTHFYIRIQWHAGTACVSECVLKTLACRGLRVGPSKLHAVRKPFGRCLWNFVETLHVGGRRFLRSMLQKSYDLVRGDHPNS